MDRERREKRREFAHWIKKVRAKTGLSLNEVSTQLGYDSRGVLANLECGNGSLPVEKIHALARIYCIDFNELLEKIKECEPELYEKYTTLERDITRHFASRIMQRPELALHHPPFAQEGAGSDNVHYRNYRGKGLIYIMSTWEQREIPFPPPKDTKTIPLFQEFKEAA